MIRDTPQERISECTLAQFAHVPVPRILEEIVEADSSAERTVEQTVDVPGPQSHEELVEVTAVGSFGAAKSKTGSVFVTPDDGGTDVFIHSKQLVDTDGLQRCNTERESTRQSTAPSFPVVAAGLLPEAGGTGRVGPNRSDVQLGCDGRAVGGVQLANPAAR